MKKMVLVLTLAILALSVNAFAQDPNYRNNIGIYLDEGGQEFCTETASGAYSAYVVLSKLVGISAVTGVEFKLVQVGNVFVSNLTGRGNSIDAGSKPGEHIIGIADPGLPVVGDACVVADLSIFVADSNPSYLFLEPVYFSSLSPKAPAFLGDGVILEAHPSLGTTADPVLILNSPCEAVATEDATWGTVKSLYR